MAWSNLVSAQGFLILGLGLKGLGPGLDNKEFELRKSCMFGGDGWPTNKYYYQVQSES